MPRRAGGLPCNRQATIWPGGWKIFPDQNTVAACPKAPTVPHRKNNPARTSPEGSKAPFTKKKNRLVRRMAQGALLAVSFSALQYFAEDTGESKRLFDSRVVDSLREPLTHYHE